MYSQVKNGAYGFYISPDLSKIIHLFVKLVKLIWFWPFSSPLILLVNKIRLCFLLLVGSVALWYLMWSNSTVELLLALLLLLPLDEGGDLGDHISWGTDIGRRQLPRSGSRSLGTSLGNEALGVQVCTHDGHARMLTHLRRVSLQFGGESNSRRPIVSNASWHSKIWPNALVAHDILLRNVAELTVVGCCEAGMRSEFLL